MEAETFTIDLGLNDKDREIVDVITDSAGKTTDEILEHLRMVSGMDEMAFARIEVALQKIGGGGRVKRKI